MTLFENSNERGAHFSICRRYRYALWRKWHDSLPLVQFIGLNPSTANEVGDDRTIQRVTAMAKHLGYGGFYMTNLFAYVSTDPAQLVLPEANDLLNDSWLYSISKSCKMIIFCWGAFKQAKERGKKVAALFPDAYCLRRTKDGSPWHPLYVPVNIQPVKFQQ